MQIAAFEDVKIHRQRRDIPGGYAWRTNFLTPPEGVMEAPMAFLAEGTPGRVIRPHFHDVDQFQVIVSGGGVLGRHPLAIHAVHFSRAHTPYGPIIANEEGLGFLTLRAHWDPGAQYLPDARERLQGLAGRKPWQVTELPRFIDANDVNLHMFSEIKDEHGLGGYSLMLKAHARAMAPDPALGHGQYIIVTKGSLTYQGKDYGAISIGFVRPDEPAIELAAGADGLEALVLSFPRPATARAVIPGAAAPRHRTWQCMLCSFTYDEAKGMPEEGIAPGTRWEDVPDTWACPDCSAAKADFEMQQIA